MNTRARWWAVAVLALASTLAAAESGLTFSLIAPGATVQPGRPVDLQVAVLNRSGGSLSVALPDELPAALVALTGRVPVRGKRMDAGGAAVVPAGGFALRTYRFELPIATPAGAAVVEASWPEAGIIRAGLEVAPAGVDVADTSVPTQRPTTTLARAEPAAAALRRTFADRIGPHEPIYFIYGPDEPGAKFQFSFKYKLLDFRAVAQQRMVRTLQFAFTQRSVWDIDGASSPFYDTSYMPELIYESLVPETADAGGWFHWLGFQAAYKHESNGRDGPVSRSVNIVYARPVFALGDLNRWHLLVIPEAFGYVSRPDDNPDLEKYRGHGKLHLVLGRNDGPTLMAALWTGKDFERFSMQLDFTVPIRTRLLNFETYLLVQYFEGYGESLRSYNEKSDTVRAGFSLVR